MGQAQHKVSEEDGALLLASLALKSQQHSPPIRIRSSCEIWPGQAEDQGMRLGLLQFSPAELSRDMALRLRGGSYSMYGGSVSIL